MCVRKHLVDANLLHERSDAPLSVFACAGRSKVESAGDDNGVAAAVDDVGMA